MRGEIGEKAKLRSSFDYRNLATNKISTMLIVRLMGKLRSGEQGVLFIIK